MCIFNFDKERFNWNEQSVIQCCYDPKIGRWRYLKFVENKEHFDRIDKIMHILEYISGEISIEELSFCLPNLSYIDTWRMLCQKAGEEVLKSLNLE